jgi:hypothetical protein
VHRYAGENRIPWVVFRKGDRKLDWVFDATKKDGPDGVPWFRFYRTERLVTCYCFYIHDRGIGPAFSKVCCYAPYPVKVWCNGHEIARRAALAERHRGDSPCQRVRRHLRPGPAAGTVRHGPGRHDPGLLRRWVNRIPLPLTDADQATAGGSSPAAGRGLPHPWSSTTPAGSAPVFEELLAGNISLGHPEHVEVIFAQKVTRRTPGTFSTRLLNRGDQVTVSRSG